MTPIRAVSRALGYLVMLKRLMMLNLCLALVAVVFTLAPATPASATTATCWFGQNSYVCTESFVTEIAPHMWECICYVQGDPYPCIAGDPDAHVWQCEIDDDYDLNYTSSSADCAFGVSGLNRGQGGGLYTGFSLSLQDGASDCAKRWNRQPNMVADLIQLWWHNEDKDKWIKVDAQPWQYNTDVASALKVKWSLGKQPPKGKGYYGVWNFNSEWYSGSWHGGAVWSGSIYLAAGHQPLGAAGLGAPSPPEDPSSPPTVANPPTPPNASAETANRLDPEDEEILEETSEIGSGLSYEPSVSDDGSVVFASDASDLTTGDTNGTTDIFLRDPLGAITLVSAGFDDSPADGPSGSPVISASGSLIAFESSATNLTEDDSGNVSNIFLYEVSSGTITMVTQGADGDSTNPAISDGGVVAFQSSADNLVAYDEYVEYSADDTNGVDDVFVWDGQIQRVSVPYVIRSLANRAELLTSEDPSEGNGPSINPSIAPDGEYVAYESEADNLTFDTDDNESSDVFVYDLAEIRPNTQLVSTDGSDHSADGVSMDAAVTTAEGTWLIALESLADDVNGYAGDTSGEGDIFVTDGNATVLVSGQSDGSGTDGESSRPSISADGATIVFESSASNLVEEEPDVVQEVYRYDAGEEPSVSLLSINGLSEPADGNCSRAAISGDGSAVAFESSASNLSDDGMEGVYTE
jgi:Tol biopolymer transport system component